MKRIVLFAVASLLVVNLSFGQRIECNTEDCIDTPPYCIAQCAEDLTNDHVNYTRAYFSIKYPMGDVPANLGCCTDVVIRTYRKLRVDLQKEIHEHIVKHPELYPNIKKTDTNIDHRRVANMMIYFRHSATDCDAVASTRGDYRPGDIVCWKLSTGDLHIGIISKTKSKEDPNRHMIVHNIGSGQVLEDCLFNWKIIGHYRAYWKC
jgi:uncharacterized protein YijF (DUF1287 family)